MPHPPCDDQSLGFLDLCNVKDSPKAFCRQSLTRGRFASFLFGSWVALLTLFRLGRIEQECQRLGAGAFQLVGSGLDGVVHQLKLHLTREPKLCLWCSCTLHGPQINELLSCYYATCWSWRVGCPTSSLKSYLMYIVVVKVDGTCHLIFISTSTEKKTVPDPLYLSGILELPNDRWQIRGWLHTWQASQVIRQWFLF